jgi:hypothetical protein
VRLFRLVVLVSLAALLSLVTGALPAPAAARGPVVPASSLGRLVVASAVAPAGVTGNDGADIYVGSGGVVFPANRWLGPEADRQSTAACVGCQWRVTELCDKNALAGGRCLRLRVGCPVGEQRVRVWVLRPGQDWSVAGEACVGDTPPATVEQVGSQLRAEAIKALPVLRPAVQPAGGVLVGIPAVFRTGQPSAGIRGADLSVLGLAILLDSRVRWHWTYGDGTAEWTSRPGGRWPDTSVSHTYLRVGPTTASVTAVWRGEYTVEGLGPFAVPGPPLTQDGVVPVDVREARAVLVG